MAARARFKHGTRAETRFRLSAKRTSPFKLAGESVQSTTGSRGVRISGSNAGYTMFRGRVQDYWLPSPLACVSFTSPTVCHQVSTELYSSTLSLTLALEGVGGNCHAPAALPSGMTRYPLCGRMGGPKGSSGRCENILPHLDSIPGPFCQ